MAGPVTVSRRQEFAPSHPSCPSAFPHALSLQRRRDAITQERPSAHFGLPAGAPLYERSGTLIRTDKTGKNAAQVAIGAEAGLMTYDPVANVAYVANRMGDTITANHEDRLLIMDGHTTFNMAVKVLSESTVAAVERAGLALDDIDLFVYHQANGRILKSVAEKLDLPVERVADYVGETGNTSAASIPLTLSLLREDGRLRPGQKLLLAAVGAGFTWGAGVVEWGVR